MLKELVARVALVLFIIGLTSEAARDDDYAGAARQQRLSPHAKNTSVPSQTAN
jgi:hypothetical protein